MASVNKVILVGNLGRDAELRYTPGGAAVATLKSETSVTRLVATSSIASIAQCTPKP